MDNEETKILNPQQESTQKTQQVNNTTSAEEKVQPKEKKDSSMRASVASGIAAGIAAGVVGGGAVFASDHINDNLTAEEEEANVEEEAPAPEPEPVAQAHPEPVAEVVETPVEEPVDAIPQDASLIDPSTPEPVNDGGEGDVEVLGVAIADNGEGGMATIAGLNVEGDLAMVVDVDSDGTIDVVAIDENGNQVFEDGEVYDATGAGLHTTDVIGAYVEQEGGNALVVNADTGENYHIVETDDSFSLASMDEQVDDYHPNDDYIAASNDDMPDYMNDADAGLMDV